MRSFGGRGLETHARTAASTTTLLACTAVAWIGEVRDAAPAGRRRRARRAGQGTGGCRAGGGTAPAPTLDGNCRGCRVACECTQHRASRGRGRQRLRRWRRRRRRHAPPAPARWWRCGRRPRRGKGGGSGAAGASGHCRARRAGDGSGGREGERGAGMCCGWARVCDGVGDRGRGAGGWGERLGAVCVCGQRRVHVHPTPNRRTGVEHTANVAPAAGAGGSGWVSRDRGVDGGIAGAGQLLRPA
jgi:hypothetical protein